MYYHFLFFLSRDPRCTLNWPRVVWHLDNCAFVRDSRREIALKNPALTAGWIHGISLVHAVNGGIVQRAEHGRMASCVELQAIGKYSQNLPSIFGS